jgi:hypothetical protein
MSLYGNNGYNGNGTGTLGANQTFIRHISRFIGETVLVFTTSGGASGSGFSGVLMEVNGDFIRLVTQQSQPPTCPISDVCDDDDDRDRGNYCNGYEDRGSSTPGVAGDYTNYQQMRSNNNNNNNRRNNRRNNNVGSVCDIPIDRIAAFCHNAV